MKACVDGTSPLRARQSTSIDVATALAQLRAAVQECGYTLDALQAVTGIDKSHLSRVLNGERALTLPFLVTLPHDVAARYEAKRAELLGNVVVTPLSGIDAQRAFLAGLVGLIGAVPLPVSANHPAKADLAPADAVERAS